jgi:monoterpene epsilon-lactone hydrolase
MTSLQNLLLRQFFKITGKNKSAETHSLAEVRRNIDRLSTVSKLPSGVNYKTEYCSEIYCEWAIPKNISNQGVVLYFHGGAFVSGSIKTHRALVGRIARASKTKCLSVEYRLAPENPYPSGLNDAIAVYKWLLKNNYNHQQIIIAGDSAGGGLAMATLIKIRDEQMPLPGAAVFLSPWLDLRSTGNSRLSLAHKDPMLKPGMSKIYTDYYAPDMDLTNPYISPYYANPVGLPPIYIKVSDSELPLDDSTRFEKNAKTVGVEVELEIWKDMLHVWHIFSPVLPEATRAIKRIGKYIEGKIVK